MASNLSGDAGALGAEAIELRNWLLRFACEKEEFRVVVANLADWMANTSPPPGCLPLVFAHVVLIKTLGTHKARDIWARIDR